MYLCGHALSAFSRKRKRPNGGEGEDDGLAGDDVGTMGDDDEKPQAKKARGGRREGGDLEDQFRNIPEGKCGAFVQIQEVRAGSLVSGAWRK